MSSNWNLFLDRKLTLNLTADEHQLADAIARSTLGWRKTEERIGSDYLMDKSGLTYRRSFTRARQGLADKGLVYFEPGRGGKGQRTLYRLLLETSALQRGLEENPNQRTDARVTSQTSAQTRAQTSAEERPLIENREKKTSLERSVNSRSVNAKPIVSEETSRDSVATPPSDRLFETLCELANTQPAEGTRAYDEARAVANELAAQGATSKTLPIAVKLMRQQWSPQAKVTVRAIGIHFAEYQADAEKRVSAGGQCDECGTGGGLHTADCSRGISAVPVASERNEDGLARVEELMQALGEKTCPRHSQDTAQEWCQDCQRCGWIPSSNGAVAA